MRKEYEEKYSGEELEAVLAELDLSYKVAVDEFVEYTVGTVDFWDSTGGEKQIKRSLDYVFGMDISSTFEEIAAETGQSFKDAVKSSMGSVLKDLAKGALEKHTDNFDLEWWNTVEKNPWDPVAEPSNKRPIPKEDIPPLRGLSNPKTNRAT